MRKLSIDIETYSDVDLIKCGVYAYANSPNFEILLFAYSVDDGEVDIIDLANGRQLPDDILKEATTPMIYNYIDENMPDWARPTIQKMKDKGFLKGDENGNLGLTDEMLRLFVTNDRAGVYDHRWDGKGE